jgi:DNA (cytosine-5)-methyltransferase 1
MAGKRLGKEDERHLWPEMLRAIREIQPRWVVGENVLGLVNWSGGLVFHEVQADLEAEGYEVQPYVLPACAVNAPHRRDRVWFVAYSKINRQSQSKGIDKWEEHKQDNRDRIWSSFDTNGSIGITSNPTSHGLNDQSTSANNSIGQNNKQSRTQRKRTAKRFSDEWPTPHPNGNGLNERNGNDEINSSQGGLDAINDIKQSIMHTNGTSKQGEHIGQTREGQFNGPDSRNGFDNFQNFPTQPPICSRNDGLSSRLDGITFSKWRNESIKAGGNAIVPQVVHQIFKAIEQYETQAIPR